MTTDPILVAASPRSGTSMVAGLLHHHGADAGHYGFHKDNPKGGFEDANIKQVMKNTLTSNGYDLNPISIQPEEFDPDPGFRFRVLQCVASPNEPWLVKEFRILMTWPLWQEHFPDAVYVLNRRNVADNLRSMQNHRVISKRGSSRALRFWIEWVRGRQERIAQHCPHVWVDADRIWRGDMGEAKKVVEVCGLDFDSKVAEDWVEPNLWHNRSAVR